jgi:hypothetical protein
VLALAAAMGCGSRGEPVESGAVRETTADAPPAPEARWIADSDIAAVLASMRRDVRSFIASGRPAESLTFIDEQGPQYYCGRKLGRGGPPPTPRLAELRRHAARACGHLQRALEASLTFRAGANPGGDEAGAARAARQARAPLAAAQKLLEAARAR